MDHNEFMDRTRAVLGKTKEVLESILQADDDDILSQSLIGTGEDMNLLQTKRERVRHLEDALTKAHQRKVSANTALVQKKEQIQNSQPVLPPGVVATFDAGQRGQIHNPSERLVIKGSGLLTLEKVTVLAAAAEQEAATMAHSAYCESFNELQQAKRELSDLERELFKLREKLECLNDL